MEKKKSFLSSTPIKAIRTGYILNVKNDIENTKEIIVHTSIGLGQRKIEKRIGNTEKKMLTR